jgi:cellulose synthase/poly-beta-1,6-N-acetylglucosamine synthase-like glycosyltransferase
MPAALATLLVALAVGCPALVLYSYAGYPLVLRLLSALHASLTRHRAAPGGRVGDAQLPCVAVVIAAYNEEQHIADRIRNLLQQDYPADRLRVYVGSDGSRDRTAELLRAVRDPNVQAVEFVQNRGKASVLNDLVARTSEPLLVFSDANTRFAPDALRRLVARFADTEVGCVAGELRLLSSGGDNQDGMYWRIEQMLKLHESRIGATLGANGAIYAIRRELWQPLAADTICDDFCVAMGVAARGHRSLYEPTAVAEEDVPASIGAEYGRRVRIGIGNFQALMRHPEYLLRTSFATRFAYLSHKVLRWLAPHLLLLGLAASAALALLGPSAGRPFWAGVAAAEAAALLLAGGLYLLSERLARSAARLPGVLAIPAFLFALNFAFLVASWRYATGSYSGSWRRTAR